MSEDGTTMFAIDGELTIYHVADWRARLMQAVAGGACRVDLSGVTEIDSAGVQLLLAARRSIEGAGRRAIFGASSAQVAQAIATLGAAPLLAEA